MSLPDGYEKAITYNLAKEIAMNFPTQQKMSAIAMKEADSSLQAIRLLNTSAPSMISDAAYVNGSRGKGIGFGWWISPF